jgi:hypothetical protein
MGEVTRQAADDGLCYVAPHEARRAGEITPDQQRVLEEVNRRVAARQSVEEMVDFLFEQTRELCPCDRVAVAFVEEEGRRVVAHYARALYEPLRLQRGYAEDLLGSSLERIIETGQVRLIGDLEAYLAGHPESRSSRLLLDEGVRSSMTAPLTVDGRVVGLLFRSSRRAFSYDRRHVRIVLSIAERLGQAIEKAHRIELLNQANQAYTEMLGFVSHELKSPVASMAMDASVLADGYLGDLTDRQVAKLRRMQGKAQYLLELVEEYLDLARLESGELTIEPRPGVDLIGEVVEQAIDLVEPQVDEKEMTLVRDWPDGPIEMDCDPRQMRIVAVNLLSNAVKYGRAGGEIRIRAARDAEGVAFCVRNEGRGFTPAQRAKLFRKFSRLDDPELRKQKGTGVGLYTVWRLVRMHGGKVVADAQPDRWAEFTVTLPQPLRQAETDPG